jgi:hypothetical protein
LNCFRIKYQQPFSGTLSLSLSFIEMTQSKDQKIAETQANLPLPEQPPKASDWQSADARTVNVGAGKQEGPIGTDSAAQSGLREPATKGEEVDLSNVGREGVEKRQQ